MGINSIKFQQVCHASLAQTAHFLVTVLEGMCVTHIQESVPVDVTMTGHLSPSGRDLAVR